MKLKLKKGDLFVATAVNFTNPSLIYLILSIDVAKKTCYVLRVQDCAVSISPWVNVDEWSFDDKFWQKV